MRQFSMLTPIQKPVVVATQEYQDLPLAAKEMADIQEAHAKFNEYCGEELKMMDQNVIQNIVDRGGNQGWDLDDFEMTKTFSFGSFEQCQDFCTRVSVIANDLDHHPEWNLTDGGRAVSVKLTSHFAGNIVTRIDYELAELMNKEEKKVSKSFKLYPRFSQQEWTSMKVGAMALVGGFIVIRAGLSLDF